MSGDTDVVVLSLYYWFQLHECGLQELWQKAGVGNTTRYMPIHKLASSHGQELCSVLPAVHSLTGCDSTSKFSTKKAALSVKPVKFLTAFGASLQDTDIENCLIDAENYVIQVVKKGSTSATMDELRYSMYHSSKNIAVHEILSPSHSAKDHILRAYYMTYLWQNVLTKIKDPDPRQYGYEVIDGLMAPVTFHRLLSDDLLPNCTTCTSCVRNTCPCQAESVECYDFCSCRKNKSDSTHQCANPY